MVDYQEMYYKMNRAMEKAINILVEAQRECEEEYLRETDPPNESEGEEVNTGGEPVARRVVCGDIRVPAPVRRKSI